MKRLFSLLLAIILISSSLMSIIPALATTIQTGDYIKGTNFSAVYYVDADANGNGSNGEWCNPTDRHIGQNPTTNTDNNLIDALLWVKQPGDSDGTCNSGPSAGTWWADYAFSLVE
jgi:endoglucanase